MKSMTKIMVSGVLAISLVLVSCQKEETENDFNIENAQEESFVSQTGNSDSEIEITSDILSPLLHVQYDGSMSREEAQLAFDAEVAKFMKSDGEASKSSALLYFEVHTYTGTASGNETDGRATLTVDFRTDRGMYRAQSDLNNPIKNDREKGVWDFYSFRKHMPFSANWVELKNATLALQGSDCWFVKSLVIYVPSDKQRSAASGYSFAWLYPNTWLCSSNSFFWDYYRNDNMNGGRLTFN